MIKNYLKTALRFLRNNRTFSFINIIGLSLGTLCCLYILLYIEQQYSYDKHEAFKNQVGIKKPWGEWLHDYMGIVASPKTPAPPPTEVR